MEKQRQIKMLSIIALVVAITGMTLGFAAFSTTLSISSSATVTPNSDDFKIKVYGFKSATSIYNIASSYDYTDILYDEDDISDSYAVPDVADADATTASIDNNLHIISNIIVNFGEHSEGYSDYVFVVKNEGKYDAYLQWDNNIISNGQTCYPLDGTTVSLVQQSCENDISSHMLIYDITTDSVKEPSDGYFKIAPGEEEFLVFSIEYTSYSPADGPFEVKFDDLQLKFSTTK